MTKEDEKRLIDELQRVYVHGGHLNHTLLDLAEAAREFRETGELRCGDEVLADGITSIYVGKVTSASGYVCERNGHYVTAMIVRPKPKIERRLLDQVALMQWFADNDWRPDDEGCYQHADYGERFTPVMWKYCGVTIDNVPSVQTLMDEWFVEVEVG